MTETILTYQVADFLFSVEGLPFEPANLLPFKAEPVNTDYIFNLKIVSSLPDCDSTFIYKTPENPTFPVITIYSLDDGYLFEMQPIPSKPVAGKMMVDSHFKHAELMFTGADSLFALNNAMMLLYAFSTAKKGVLEMHSSVVINGGKGYLFLGCSGTGKSTHSQLWIKHIPGTELLNDDNPILRLLPDGSVRVYGSPWSGKTPCYKAKDVPVGAIVKLKQAPYNKIVKQPIIKAYASLLESASGFRPLESFSEGWHRTMEGICAAIPFYSLECLPDKEAAFLCYNTVNE